MSNSAKQDKIDILKNLLREMFQLNRGDLDFGLYRIMSLKAAEIEEFLDKQLLPQVLSTLDSSAADKLAKLEQELDETLETVRKLGGVNPEDTDKVKNLRHQIAEARKDDAVEADVYNHLGNFFARYYSEGDFMSQRRYSGGGQSSYLVPYDGEDVKLHWANADQYYIKTTENYASYIFTVGEGDDKQRIRLETTKADSEKDNIKATNGKQRRFVLSSGKGSCKAAVEQDGDDIVIRFEHRPLKDSEKKKWPGNGNGNGNGGGQQGKINAASHERIQKKLAEQCPQLFLKAPTDADPERTVLAKHLTAYTAKNSFDYFIHKDLGGFLERELDLYLNTEVLNLDDITLGDEAQLNRTLLRARAVRHVAKKIIAFLAQLEDYQKQLWLKKKFVLDTQYCVTLDRIPESLYAQIAKNKAQREEWVRLFAIDDINGDLAGSVAATKPLKPAFLKANPHLVLDTRHFDKGFTDKLLAALSEDAPLDEQMDGLLIHGENFQALNLLQERYAHQVKCVHIDPPYNTSTSGFLYKNGYWHSSWMAMMESRIDLAYNFLSSDGAFLCHIDEHEYERLHLMFHRYPLLNAGTIIWDKRNPMTGGGGIAIQHEYVLWRSKTDAAVHRNGDNFQAMLTKAAELVATHSGATEEAKSAYTDWVVNNEILKGGEKAYRFLDDEGQIYRNVSLRAPEPRQDPKFHEPLIHPETGEPCAVPPNGFSRTPETLQKMLENGEILFGVDHSTQPGQKRVLTGGSKMQMTSVIQDAKRGKADLDKLGVAHFPYCHAVSFYSELLGATSNQSDILLDYFAGSGTTGHATINLNREDGGQRKYILVEMGEHFEDVLLSRLKKVVYSKDWKEGKPVSREGASQFFKYMRLESYEDTLDGLELTPQTGTQKEMLASGSELAEDYQLRYALGTETANSATLLGKDFADPWGYTLSVVRDGERQSVAADLPETFNYLIGLRVERRKMTDGVLAIVGTDAGGNRCLVLWRDTTKTENTKLDKWFKRSHKTFGEFDLVYANGDHTLNAVRPKGETWEARPIEPVFRELMFGTDN